jgi:hypothetical protein
MNAAQCRIRTKRVPQTIKNNGAGSATFGADSAMVLRVRVAPAEFDRLGAALLFRSSNVPVCRFRLFLIDKDAYQKKTSLRPGQTPKSDQARFGGLGLGGTARGQARPMLGSNLPQLDPAVVVPFRGGC